MSNGEWVQTALDAFFRAFVVSMLILILARSYRK